MMKISKISDYAVRCVVYLAKKSMNAKRKEEIKPSSVREISSAVGLPGKVGIKITNLLKKNGFITSVKGKAGGYVLKIPPENISVLLILNKVNGGMDISRCTVNSKCCEKSSVCALRDYLIEIRDFVHRKLSSLTVKHLAEIEMERERKIKH